MNIPSVLRFSMLLPIIAAWSTTTHASSFEGLTVESSIINRSDQTTGGPWVKDPNVMGNGPQTLGKNSKISAALDLGYGISLSTNVVLTSGLAYTPGTNTVTSSYAKDPTGLLNVPVKSRIDFYVAPGLKLSPAQMVYLKAGYSSFKYGTSTDETGAPQNGQPGRNGFLLGVGYKQLLNANSPGYFHVSYTAAQSSNGRIDDGTKYLDTKLKSGIFGIGLGYSF